jgi:uncharacterized HAD superfamily protein
LRIGLDFDGVITDCGDLKSIAAMELYGVNIPPKDFKKEFVVGNGLLTMNQYRKLQQVIYETHEWGLRMEMVDEWIPSYLNLLEREGHKLVVVTSRGGAALDVARKWSRRQNIDHYFELVGTGGQSKVDALRGFDLYVDDDFDKLEPLVGIVPQLFLFSWGYNMNAPVHGVAKRVSSWMELLRVIKVHGGAR